MNKRASKHFAKLWELIMLTVRDALDECDPGFRKECALQMVNEDSLKATVERTYRELREDLKHECYGKGEDRQSLDSRKIAAVICCALIKERALAFDGESALAILSKKEEQLKTGEIPNRVRLNKWIADNFFINYKIAYLSGLRIIFTTLLSELLKVEEDVALGKELAERGCLIQYPTDPVLDTFDVNMVLGLGRANIQRKEIDSFMLAQQFYQIEMYARKSLELKIMTRK